jgi:hypothetical protein
MVFEGSNSFLDGSIVSLCTNNCMTYIYVSRLYSGKNDVKLRFRI